ncbi:MAG TPA: hypothetical protein VEA59_02880, partial [Patescibacteria group bacterium]|nr:hypothetical protein [Patescibacteria group bacterium]
LLYVQTMDGAVQIWNLTPLQFRDDGGNPIVGNRYAYIQGDNDWLFPGFDKSLFEAGNQALSDIQLYSPFPAEISFGKPVPTSFVLEHGKVAERVFTGEVYEPSATKDPYVRTIEYAASFSHPADETGKTEIRSVVLGLEHWYPTRDAGRLVNLVRNGGYLSFYLGSQINGSDIKIWP